MKQLSPRCTPSDWTDTEHAMDLFKKSGSKAKEKQDFSKPPEFVRNVVGSSAAAGSAEFHIFLGVSIQLEFYSDCMIELDSLV